MITVMEDELFPDGHCRSAMAVIMDIAKEVILPLSFISKVSIMKIRSSISMWYCGELM